MQHATIAIIGAGNMGCSLIGGLIADGYPASKIWAANPVQAPLTRLDEQWHIHTTLDNKVAAEAADVLVLSVKPHVMPTVASELSLIVRTKHLLVVSIAAGVAVSSLQKWLGENSAIVRCMPNTPALVGCGATGLYANAHVNQVQREMAESIMRAVGVTVWLTEESQMDIVTALSGSGPAYFLLVMEALEQAAVDLGLPKEVAKLLTLQTALGAARLALESGEETVELRRRVTSPGGTTEQALKVLEMGKAQDLFSKALKAAQQRSIELAALAEKR